MKNNYPWNQMNLSEVGKDNVYQRIDTIDW
jgi:hypothetical protein